VLPTFPGPAGFQFVSLDLEPLFKLASKKTGLGQRNDALNVLMMTIANQVRYPLHEDGFLGEDEGILRGGAFRDHSKNDTE
jgi:hypothetical protein